jgi:hypothetical protein
MQIQNKSMLDMFIKQQIFLYRLSAKRTDVDTGNKHGRHYSKVLDKTKRVARSQNHRYIIFVGNKRQKKYLLNNLRYKIQPIS